MIRIPAGDSKPQNYNYVTFNIISSTPNGGKAKLLSALERLLLKGIMLKPCFENKVDLTHVRLFSAKDEASEILIWYIELMDQKREIHKLIKKYRPGLS